MIVRQLQDSEKGKRRVVTKNWESTRLLLKKDSMGFSFHITTMYAGTSTHMWYQNHFESVYCIEGSGEIEELSNGKVHQIRPGTMYALNEHDEHEVRAKTNLVLACVFNPPLNGNEVHNEEGVYPLEAEEISD